MFCLCLIWYLCDNLEQVRSEITKFSLWVLTIVPFVIWILVLWSRYYIKTYRELSRLQNVTGSPLISHLGETMNGLSTIRAFKKEKSFIDKNIEILNAKLNISFWKESLKSWFGLRIILACSTIFLFTGVFWVSNLITKI